MTPTEWGFPPVRIKEFFPRYIFSFFTFFIVFGDLPLGGPLSFVAPSLSQKLTASFFFYGVCLSASFLHLVPFTELKIVWAQSLIIEGIDIFRYLSFPFRFSFSPGDFFLFLFPFFFNPKEDFLLIFLSDIFSL